MIKLVYDKFKITVSGHADYATYGKDIVCASVSSVIFTTVNAIMGIDKSAIHFVDDTVMEIIVLKQSDIVNKLIQNMIDILSDLEKQYPKNLKIVKKGE